MTKTAWFLVFCALTLVVCAALLMDALPELIDRREPAPRHRDPLGLPDAGYREVEIPEPAPDESAPVTEAIRLAITGRVVGPDLEPLPGDVELEFGPEIARARGDGRVDVEAAGRSGPVGLALRRGGELLERWPGVVVGETPVPVLPYALGAFGLEDALVRPSSIRWSITLTSAAAVAGRTAPPQESDGVDDGAPGEERDARGEDEKEKEGASPDLALPPGQYLEIDSVLVEEWGPSGAVHVRGRSTLPDGLHVCIALVFRDSPLVSAPSCPSIRAGRFESSFLLPESFRIFSDVYELRASFSPAQEELRFMEEIRRGHPGIPWEELDELGLARAIFIGFPAEKREDDLAAQRHIASTIDRITRLRRVFAKKFDDTVKLSRGWDPGLLEDIRSSRQGWLKTAAVGPSGEFLEEEWRAFLGEWRALVREMVEREVAREDAKYQAARNSLERLLKSVYQLSFVESNMLYGQFGLRMHADDIYDLSDGLEGSRVLLLKMVDEHHKILLPYRDLVPD